MNSAMGAHYAADHASSKATIPLDLYGIINSDIILKDDCVFLESLYLCKGNASRAQFSDQTGYEAFVNHIHIDEYSSSWEEAIIISFACIGLLRDKWYTCKVASGKLLISIEMSADNYVLRFHYIRPGETWYAEDLEAYEEAIAIEVVDNTNASIRGA